MSYTVLVFATHSTRSKVAATFGPFGTQEQADTFRRTLKTGVTLPHYNPDMGSVARMSRELDRPFGDDQSEQ